MGLVTLHPNAQPKFSKLFTQRFTQKDIITGCELGFSDGPATELSLGGIRETVFDRP